MGRKKGSTNKKIGKQDSGTQSEDVGLTAWTSDTETHDTVTASDLPDAEQGDVNETPKSEPEKEKNGFENLETDLSEIDAVINRQTAPTLSDSGNVEKRGRKSKDEKAKAQIRISGYLFSYVNNRLISGILSWSSGKLGKDAIHIPAEILRGNEKFLQEIAPIGDLAVKELGLEENPVAAFYILMGSEALTNMLEFQAFLKRMKKENPTMDIDKALEVYAKVKG